MTSWIGAACGAALMMCALVSGAEAYNVDASGYFYVDGRDPYYTGSFSIANGSISFSYDYHRNCTPDCGYGQGSTIKDDIKIDGFGQVYEYKYSIFKAITPYDDFISFEAKFVLRNSSIVGDHFASYPDGTVIYDNAVLGKEDFVGTINLSYYRYEMGSGSMFPQYIGNVSFNSQGNIGVDGNILITDASFSPSTVPLPSSAPLFGIALLGLGALGYGMKRRGRVAAG